MAKKAKRATASTGTRRKRRMNGAKRTVRRRRMNGAAGTGEVKEVLGLAVGAILGGYAIGAAEKLVSNYNVRAGGVALVGLILAKKGGGMAKAIGKGAAVAGVVGIGTNLLAKSGIAPGNLNGKRRRLNAAELATLSAGVRKGIATLNGRDMGTLSEAAPMDEVVVVMD